MGDEFYRRGYSPLDHMKAYLDHDVSETTRLYEEAFGLPATEHEYTSEQNGNTVIVFNTKVVIVTESGDVREYARV
jgi:hypothetical protein